MASPRRLQGRALVRTAVAYWADSPDEVEALLEHATRVQTQAATAQERTSTLLAQ